MTLRSFSLRLVTVLMLTVLFALPAAAAWVIPRHYRFDGQQDYVEIAHTSALNLGTRNFTLAARIQTTATTGIRVILEKRLETPELVRGYSLWLYRGRLLLALADGLGHSWTRYDSGVSVADGRWHAVAVTVDRRAQAGGRWYVDGVEVGQPFDPRGRRGSLDTTQTLLIGGSRGDAPLGRHFVGHIGDIRLYQRVLTVNELRAIAHRHP